MNKIQSTFKNKAFSSFTNMEDAQWALALAAVNHNVGGVLISGKAGTGKSSLIQALADILPNKKLIKLPLSITEETLNGILDIENTLQKGQYHYHKGILDALHNNILFINNINLLSAKILNKILQIQEAEYFYTPDGKKSLCKFSIIATINTEEGSITTKVLDRFGLFLEIPLQNKINNRLEILKQHEYWEKYPEKQYKIYTEDNQNWEKRLQTAEKLIPKIKITDNDLLSIAQICKEAYVSGHRGDLALLWASVSYAALNGRTSISMQDILKVKDWALAHRIRNPKREEPQQPETENKEQDKQSQNPEKQANNNEDKQANNDNTEQKEQEALPNLSHNDNSNATEDNPKEEWFNIGNLELKTDILQHQNKLTEKREGSGKRIKCKDSEGKGRHIRSERIKQDKTRDIDFVATIRSAAPYQSIRAKNGLAINIHKDDLHRKLREHRIGNTILFLVDASGSMGIQQRMKEAKAGVFNMLKDAYVHRDSVGLMTFRKEESKLLLPPTRSVTRAYDLLKNIKTGGRTPLYHALQSALELLLNLKRKDKDNIPIMILFTDGKATSSYKGENSKEKLQQIAKKYADLKIKTFLIDTECGYIKLGYAKQLAKTMQAEYYKLDELSKKNLEVGRKQELKQL